MMERAQQYFDNHNTANRLFFTADGLAFFDEQDALGHAIDLEDVNIRAMNRTQAEEAAANLAEGYDDEEEYDPLDEPDAE